MTTTKKPAITTQLKTAKAAIVELEAKVTQLEKELESTKSSKDLWYKSCKEKEAEVETIHDFLDALPNAIDREYVKKDHYGSYQRSIITRLVAWMMVKDTKQVNASYTETN